MQLLVETQGLGRRFGKLSAVEDVALHVGQGEILALLGPNGAGKTTTMQMLAALLAPSQGYARVAGHDVVKEANAVRQQVGIMLDEPGFYQEMPLEDYLLFFAKLYGLSAAGISGDMLDLLERFNLGDKRRAKLETLSKGMRQKVSLTRALLHRPPVLLLDEPTSALDPLSARAVQEYIVQRRQDGAAIIISTHNLPEAELLADRIAIMARGRVRKQGSPDELRRLPDGSELYAVTVSGPQDGHIPALQAIDGALQVELALATDDEHTIAYRTTTPRQTNAAIIGTLVHGGADVVSLMPRPRSLAQVYLDAIAEAEE